MRTPVLDAARPAVHALARRYFGLRLRGTEHIPPSGPLIITPNHQTYADPPLVSIPVRRAVHYMAWDRLFAIPGLAGLIRLFRAFPVDVDARDVRAARTAARLLRDGHVVMIFPEGSRTTTGEVGQFKPGAFRLAAGLGAPVLPVAIDGGHECWPPGRTLPRPGRMTITYHPPVLPDSRLSSRLAAQELSERVRTAIVATLAEHPRVRRRA